MIIVCSFILRLSWFSYSKVFLRTSQPGTQ